MNEVNEEVEAQDIVDTKSPQSKFKRLSRIESNLVKVTQNMTYQQIT